MIDTIIGIDQVFTLCTMHKSPRSSDMSPAIFSAELSTSTLCVYGL